MLYDRSDFDCIKRDYNRKRIESRIEGAQRQLQDAQENIEKYITACREQLHVIAATKILHHVYLRRRENYKGRIEFYVSVLYYPDIPDGQRIGWFGDHQAFGGRERKAAQEYALELAKAHKCEIVREGF